MQVHDLIQGSPEWHAYRANHFNASDAPAMMGQSPYKTRSQLLKECATGLIEEIDSRTQELFDAGHRTEALARPHGEKIAGKTFYPVVGSKGILSASFDGLTMAEDIAFEHKMLNAGLRDAMFEDCTGRDLPLLYRIQLEQQCMISGVERILFMATKWDGETLIETRHCWYEPDQELAIEIEAGWAQFHIDKENYTQVNIIEAPKAEAIKGLPALVLQIKGEVVNSNFPLFIEAADAFIANIKTDLVTDQDFADAEAMVKFCDSAEKDLDQAKRSAIAQTTSIDELMRGIDHIAAQLRNKRLALEKLVKFKKESIKETILLEAKYAFSQHVAALESELHPIKLLIDNPDFAGAMKAKRTITSLRDAVDTLTASAKIATSQIAADYRAKIAWQNESFAEFGYLFKDMQQIIAKPLEDFKLLVESRIAEHRRAEADKAEKLRAQIVEEERIKAEKAAAEKVAAEQSVLTEQKCKEDADLLVQQSAESIAKNVSTATQTNFGHIHRGATSGIPASKHSPVPVKEVPQATLALVPTSDSQIIDVLMDVFNWTEAEAINRLEKIDFAAARKNLVATAA